MDNSVIRFLRKFGEDGKPIETSYDVALVCLNELNHIIGQPVVVAYYSDYDPITKTGTKINAITAIGIKNGVGNDCYAIISNGEIEQVHLVSNTTVDDVSTLVNGLVAVCYDENNIPCYCTYDEQNEERIFTPIGEDKTFYSGYDGFLWFASNGVIKRSDDFMSRDETKEYVESLLQNIDLNNLKGNQDIVWTDTSDDDYTKIVDIPTGNSLILSVSIIKNGEVSTDMIYYTSSSDPDMPEYALLSDRFYEYRSTPGVPGGICVKSRSASDRPTTYKFKVIYSSNPTNTRWYSDYLVNTRPDLATGNTTTIVDDGSKIFKKFTKLTSGSSSISSTDNSILVERDGDSFSLVSNSKYEKEFKYIRENITAVTSWVEVLKIPRNTINDYYLGKLPILLYIEDKKAGGLVSIEVNDNRNCNILTPDFSFNQLSIDLGYSKGDDSYSIWFRFDYEDYENLSIKVISAPINDWSYSTEGYDITKPNRNPYTTTNSGVEKYIFETTSTDEITENSTKLITSGAVYSLLEMVRNLPIGGNSGISSIVIDDDTYTSETVDLTSKVEVLNNKVTSINEYSTDTQYPSARAVYLLFTGINEILEDLDNRLSALEEMDKGIVSIKVPGALGSTEVINGDENRLADISRYVETSYNKTSVLPENSENDNILYPTVGLLKSCLIENNQQSIEVSNSFDDSHNYKYKSAIQVTSIPCKIDVSYTNISGGKLSDTLYILDRNNNGDVSLRTNTTSDIFSLKYNNGNYYVCIPAKKFSENETTCIYKFGKTGIGNFISISGNSFYETTVESEYVGSDSIYYGEDITYTTSSSVTADFDFNRYTNIIYTGKASRNGINIQNSTIGSLPGDNKIFHFVNTSGDILNSVTLAGINDSSEIISNTATDIIPGSEVIFTYLKSEERIISEIRLQRYHSSDNSISITRDGNNSWNFISNTGGPIVLKIDSDNFSSYVKPIISGVYELALPETWKDINVYFTEDAYTLFGENEFIYRICPKLIESCDGIRITLSGYFKLGFSNTNTKDSDNTYYIGNVNNNMLETDTSILTKVIPEDTSYTAYVYDSNRYFPVIPGDKRFIDFVNWNGKWYCNGLYNPNVLNIDETTVKVGGIELNTSFTNTPIVDVLKEMLCPYVAPVFNSFSPSVSNIVTTSSYNLKLNASLTKGTTNLNVKFKQGNNLLGEYNYTDRNGTSVTPNVSITTPVATTTYTLEFTPEASGGKGGNLTTKTTTINVFDPIYCVVSTKRNLENLTISEIEASTVKFNAQVENATYSSSWLKVTNTNQYVLALAWDKKYNGTVTSIIDSSNAEIVDKFREITIENTYTVFGLVLESPNIGYYIKTIKFGSITFTKK
jgi:hypothetical protein